MSKAMAERLEAAGLDADTARTKATLFASATETLARHTGGNHGAPAAIFVPGRIEVVGKHVDYAAGRSLVCAVNRGFCLAVRPREDATVRMLRADGGGESAFPLSLEVPALPGDWSNYPRTVARRIARNFHEARRGADIAFASDLPPASGLSSSSALVVATFLALMRVNDLSNNPTYRKELSTLENLAGYLGAVENGLGYGALAGDHGVGTFGGSEDHAAILASQPDRLSQFAYCPARLERRVPLPAGYTFAIGFCGAHAEKTGNALEKYNRASRLTTEAIEIWRRETGRNDAYLARAVASAPNAVEEIRAVLGRVSRPDVLQRFEHFYAENEEIVPQAGGALERGDVSAFGSVVDRSQQLTEEWLGNQVPQTIHLARAARRLGAAAASAFGAGFGGSVWALVQANDADAFLKQWSADYASAFPSEARRAIWFTTPAGPPAFAVNPSDH